MPSSAYDAAVGAPIRQTACKVIIDVIDMTAAPDATFSASDKETSVSRFSDIIDGQVSVSPTQRWTTLEPGYFRLDGSNKITPHVNQYVSKNVGYWSSTLSGDNGVFDEPIDIIVNFTSHHKSMGIIIYFDDEYPIDFDVAWYGDGDVELARVSVFDNDSYYIMIDQIVDDYTKIIITVTKIKTANRRLRIYEIIFGVQRTFLDDQIISARVTRELSIIDEVLPASEFSFELDNSDKRFNLLNPQGIYKYIQTNQLISGFIGVYTSDTDIEYVSVGQYYMDEWEAEGITASFTGRDCLYFIQDSLQYTVSSATTKTLYAWLTTLFSRANITKYSIDSSLSNISVSTSFYSTSVKSLIRSVCTAGCCIIYVDNDNVVQVKPINKNIVGTIGADNAYAFPKINLDSNYNTVKVGIWDSSSKTVTSYVNVSQRENAETVVTYEVDDNPFIVSRSMANAVANYYLVLLKKREIYKID